MRRAIARALVGWSCALVAIAAAALVGHEATLRSGLDRLRDTAEHRLDMVWAQLDSQQARFDYLPPLLEMMPAVSSLLEAPTDGRLRDEVDQYLHGINATAGAANLYVLSDTGLGLAAADWSEPGTPVGFDLSFRPYVLDALAGGRGHFYGVGITSKRAGYFLSYALVLHDRVRGVAVVKIDLEEAERSWRKLPGTVMLADERDVTILSSYGPWKYRPLAPLAPAVLSDIGKSRPYGTAELIPLVWHVQRRLAADSGMVRLEDAAYLVTERRVNGDRWRLLILDDTGPVQATARLVAITAALAMAVIWLLGLTLWQRQRAIWQKLAGRAALQAAHDSLEAVVTRRTAELLSANALLSDEVEARKAIEADLRATQNELIHTGKMAALGQMSAGMVHELNQPLGALRTLSDNACVLLDKNRLPEARGNLERIGHLVDRLGRLTHRLKAFAHKTEAPGAPVSVRQAIANAHFLVSQRLRDQCVEFDVQVEPPALVIPGDEARLEQVLVNLFGNAIDAMAAAPARQLRVAAGVTDSRYRIAVSDTGAGIRADILPRLFEPFTTTKPAGTGLGLGLMISAHIVREFGGSLVAENIEGGGARFVIDLPLAAPTQEYSS